ncbi:Fps/Fes/Fer/CIP4 homology [Penicillium concentricum]|uniref:Fps/Fes/Fer/CIP4 homology n=1 Tax=Penicillium concentricum TaxID=293559 RepID=A0A9W9RBZ5_9EURO|nr:Fps/Fes/Fer/CIP4 homology [Penicillium concentricum]KAJ5356519.1 Fps/Fes/Fer/CIP4 homology [Penicillium concentricum]
MPGFSDSFWTPDYASGLGVLYGKLQQGVVENKQILAIASMRADAEEQYGLRMGDIAPSVDRMTAVGFGKDDGASVRKAYEGIRTEMIEASKNHQKIANNIRELVVSPYRRWSEQHDMRVQYSHDLLQSRIKEHTKQAELVRKLRSTYFNKCRVVEDLEEENKLAFQDPESSPKIKATPKIVLPVEEEPDEDPIELGERIFPPDHIKKLLSHMLDNIKLGEAKVPIIGTYLNVSTGADIAQYIQTYMEADNLAQVEIIGQDMVDNGLLRLVGNMGNLQDELSMAPQGLPTYRYPRKKKPLMRVTSVASSEDGNGSDSPIASVSEILSGWNPLNNPYPNETPSEKLRREALEADERYKVAVRKLDQIRCRLEEEVIGQLKYMEQCELDRLKAIKAVVLDFSGAISNVIPNLQSTVDHMMLYQETIQPLGDLRYLLENYRTGGFVPKIQAYENYYGSVEEQNFGVDLEARARADRKRVPILITTILTYLDNRKKSMEYVRILETTLTNPTGYPELEGDETRRMIWLTEVDLSTTHKLRQVLNNSKADYAEVLPRFEIPVIASVLRLYLLELPDSLVSSQVYEIVKTIYSTTAHETTEEGRIKVLQSTLGQLRLVNIATLDAIMTHFTRLIDLTSADEEYITSPFSPCILRPRIESSLTMNERHSYRLIRDLFAHKDSIFGELKRQSSALGITSAGSNRPRAISTDESNRRAAMEARQRAIVNRSRATSPANRQRHRRDRSSGASEIGRFPINVSSPSDRRSTRGTSLDVPANKAPQPESEDAPTVNTQVAEPVTNGTYTESPASAAASNSAHSSSPSPPPVLPETASDDSPTPTPTPAAASAEFEKRSSMSRSSGARYSRKPGLGSVSSFPTGSAAGASGTDSNRSSIAESEPNRVTLEDKPMDD